MTPQNSYLLSGPESFARIPQVIRSRNQTRLFRARLRSPRLIAFAVCCLFQTALSAEEITVSSGTIFPNCGSHGYCETYGGHVTYHVHYTSLPAGNYRIDSANGIVVDFDNPTSGSGSVIGNGGGDYFNNNDVPDGTIAKD